MKKETLEEASEKKRQESFMCCSLSKTVDYVTVGEREKSAFIEGANWQAERMYSEEDLREAYMVGKHGGTTQVYYEFKEWFEQFKK
jgi:hypothetical protein